MNSEQLEKLAAEKLAEVFLQMFKVKEKGDPQAKPCGHNPELEKLFADMKAAEQMFRERRGQTDESHS